MIENYALVSEGAILRDYTTPQYINDEHKRLVDIADSLYNLNIPVSEWGENPEFNYKELYAKYSAEFWELVLKDMHALDSQLDINKAGDLLAEYTMLVDGF